MCQDPAGNRLYLTNQYDQSVTVFDCAVESVVAVVPVGRVPREMCFSSASNRLYCINVYDSTLSVIDAVTSTVRATLPVGTAADQLCYVADVDRVYCSNNGSADLSVIDCAGDSVLTRVPVNVGPRNLCAIPGRSVLYCTHTQSLDHLVIDCAANQVVDTIVMQTPYGLLCSPVSRKVYASMMPSWLGVLDGESDTVLVIHDVGRSPGSLCEVPARNQVYCAGGQSRLVHVIDEEVQTGFAFSRLLHPAPGTQADLDPAAIKAGVIRELVFLG